MKDFSFPLSRHVNSDGHDINSISVCVDRCYGSDDVKELIEIELMTYNLKE